MTAEIAILNKSAVVLAADSAMTIGTGGSAKIFNTANKIFEISNSSPIGLMIFNRLDFMDLPLEVLAKDFRRRRGQMDFPSVHDCRLDFVKYLENEVTFSEMDRAQNFATIAYDALNYVAFEFNQALNAHILATKRVLVSKFNGILKSVLVADIERLEKLDKAQGFGKVGLSDEFKQIIDDFLPSVFPNLQLNQVCKTLTYKLVSLTLSQERLSSYHTGLVFAGFGGDEICPTLDHVEMDGILDGKLKLVERKFIDIGRSGPAADIIGFAQDDMVQSFVNGVDPTLREYSQTLIREAVEQSARLILGPILNDDTKLSAALTQLTPDFDALSDKLKLKRDQYTEKNYTQEVKDMVRSMPKDELANLAESLIDITSLKRKVTRDRETVGGDVDVAVISKSDGLVWVKRKHYFPSELNTRYHARADRT